MPDELNLAFVGAGCDKPRREGTAKGSPRWISCCANPATLVRSTNVQPYDAKPTPLGVDHG